MDLSGLSIVITGASSGIGEAAARQLAAAGAAVHLVARRAEELERVAGAIRDAGGEATTHPADLGEADALDGLIAGIEAVAGPIHVLVNNAGRSIRRPIREALDRFHDYRRTMELNYFAAVRLTLDVLPGMLERGRGQVINVSSMSALMPTPYYSAYVATKAALDAFSRSVAAELVDSGVTVTSINYPLVQTPMTAPTKHYKYLRQMDVDDAARWIVDAIEDRPVRRTSRLGAAWNLSTALLPDTTTRWTGRAFSYLATRLQKRAETEG